jgi:hypothetical protein
MTFSTGVGTIVPLCPCFGRFGTFRLRNLCCYGAEETAKKRSKGATNAAGRQRFHGDFESKFGTH